MNRKIRVAAGQNIGDIAVQYCGTHQAIFEIARLNGMSVTDEVSAGTEIVVPDVIDRRVRKIYVEGNYFPATNGEILSGGIGSMGIEFDFIVQ